jgi:hypothetical protein
LGFPTGCTTSHQTPILDEVALGYQPPSEALPITSQEFIKFWGKFFAFVLLEMIGNSQVFKTFESI